MTGGSAAIHWADAAAEAVIGSGRPAVVSSGISPSGKIHIGNMREVLTADAVYRALKDRGDVELATDAEDLSVHEAIEHHAGDFDGFLVRHATSCDHLRLDAERLLDLRELRPAAMHEHDANADLMQDRDLLDELARRFRIAENTAARLDDEHLAFVHADVRRGAAQRANGN